MTINMLHDFFESESGTPTRTRDFKHAGYSFACSSAAFIHIVLSLPLGKSSSHLYIFLKLCELTFIQYAADSGAYAAKSSV